MKKLMLALVVAAVAVASQAATIKWNSGTVKTQAGSNANDSDRIVTAMLFSLNASDYAAIDTMTAADVYDKYVVNGTTAVTPVKTTKMGVANVTQTVAGGSSESPATYYGLLVYVDEASAASVAGTDAYVKYIAKSASFQDDGTASFTSLATAAGSWSAIQSVPEPTSGLLLLLGMAGLALKRKQA